MVELLEDGGVLKKVKLDIPCFFKQFMDWQESNNKIFAHLKEQHLVGPNARRLRMSDVLTDDDLLVISERMPRNVNELSVITNMEREAIWLFGSQIISILDNIRLIDGASSVDSQFNDRLVHAGTISVSAFIKRLNVQFDKIHVKIRWEISQWKISTTGHAYFSLKDIGDEGVIDCVIFRGNLRLVSFNIVIGSEVIVTASPNIYAKTGSFTVIAKTLELTGEWVLKKAYEELKSRLEKEGIFDLDSKKTIPKYVQRIGLVSSKGGVVIQDFVKNIWNRGFKISLLDSRVEWPLAIQGLLSAIKSAQSLDLDVLVIIRWGWSLESMQAFNSELLVRAIASSRIPVICGIWHDIDVPLVSLAASESCSTPSMVAQRLDAPYVQLEHTLERAKDGLLRSFNSLLGSRINDCRLRTIALESNLRTVCMEFETYDHIRSRFLLVTAFYIKRQANAFEIIGNSIVAHQNKSIVLASRIVETTNSIPIKLYAKILIKLDQWRYDLSRSFAILKWQCAKSSSDVNGRADAITISFLRNIERFRKKIDLYESLLRVHDPTRLLSLWYGIITLNGIVVKNISQIAQGNIITGKVSDGEFSAQITETFHENW